uniref:Uncharacterized protein n=1 Tax=Timema poppense TaxID=170557 RepID=A0A7R9CSC0_TIMPO|nr:unnamed protein product [Timema poppensis]
MTGVKSRSFVAGADHLKSSLAVNPFSSFAYVMHLQLPGLLLCTGLVPYPCCNFLPQLLVTASPFLVSVIPGADVPGCLEVSCTSNSHMFDFPSSPFGPVIKDRIQVELDSGLIMLAQLRGSTSFKLTPHNPCNSSCPELLGDLQEGEM